MRLRLPDNSDREWILAAAKAIYQYAPAAVGLSNNEHYQIPLSEGQLQRLHGGDRADVYLVEIGQRRCCAKFFHDTRPLSYLKNLWGIGRAFSAYRNGVTVKKLGIACPAVLGVYMQGALASPILIMELIDGYQQINLVLEDWKTESADLADSPRLAKLAMAFAQFTKNLHTNGVFHRDYSPRNVLMRESNGEFSFCLTDLEDVFFTGDSDKNIDHFKQRLPRYLSSRECAFFISHFNQQLTNSSIA